MLKQKIKLAENEEVEVNFNFAKCVNFIILNVSYDSGYSCCNGKIRISREILPVQVSLVCREKNFAKTISMQTNYLKKYVGNLPAGKYSLSACIGGKSGILNFSIPTDNLQLTLVLK